MNVARENFMENRVLFEITTKDVITIANGIDSPRSGIHLTDKEKANNRDEAISRTVCVPSIFSSLLRKAIAWNYGKANTLRVARV